MTTGFLFSYNGFTVDLDQYYVRTDYFTQGSLWAFGRNTSGELGDNSITHRSSPVQTIASGINWLQVAASGTSAGGTGGIKTDGTLWMWGGNGYGQLGDNSITHRSSPVQTVAGGTTWKQVSCGWTHSAGIKTDGTLWMWGKNTNGQLGDGTVALKSSPVQTVTFGANWLQVSCGYESTAAIKTDGTLWTWGLNASGQLGDNTVVKKSSPVQTVAFGTNWAQVSMGTGTMAAIKTDGTLWACGSNSLGQVGDGTITLKSSPVQTAAFGSNWKQVFVGDVLTGAVKTDGTLWMWGKNTNGQLGDGTIVSKSSPVQTIAFSNNWKQVAAGGVFAAAIKSDGTLWTWGKNSYGELGDGTITHRSSPVQTTAFGTNWKSCSVGYDYSTAINRIDFYE
jgi:alpha-tubulin suppressor-like RCC1 family protein